MKEEENATSHHMKGEEPKSDAADRAVQVVALSARIGSRRVYSGRVISVDVDSVRFPNPA